MRTGEPASSRPPLGDGSRVEGAESLAASWRTFLPPGTTHSGTATDGGPVVRQSAR